MSLSTEAESSSREGSELVHGVELALEGRDLVHRGQRADLQRDVNLLVEAVSL